jgi:crotonobetainyl-CoA:carnitine CoA-transferase CaiB-like acyl-CoA transferase
LLDYFANGREAQPIGNADPFGQWCPNEVFRCGDQHELAITCRTDDEWHRLCETVSWDLADLAAEPGLQTAAGRFARVGEIDERLAGWCATRSADAAVEALQANGVPAGKVQDGGDLMGDPQHVARAFFRTASHDRFGERPFDRFPAMWSDTDLEPYVLAGSYVGEHNFEVYRDLVGLDGEDVAAGIGDGRFT